MNAPIRVLHFADVHVGMENFGGTDVETGVSRRVKDFLQRLDDMIDVAREGDVDLVIFCGDAFRSRSPSPTYQREFAGRVRQFAQLAPTVLLLGNHDMPQNASKASTVEIFDTLGVPNIWVAQDYAARRIATARGDIVLGAAPYPVRARLLAEADARRLNLAEQDAELQRSLHARLEALGQEAEALADAATPRLLAGHFSVSGASWGSERTVMLGWDPVVDLSAIAQPRWDYVALGHVHRHQNLTAGRADLPPVVYSGSPERIDFGEEGERKGFCWVDLQRGRADWRFIELAARVMRTLAIDCLASDDPTGAVLDALRRAELRNAIVRLQIRLTPESETLLNERQILDALKRASVFHIAGIGKEVDRRARTRLAVSPEGLAPLELLEKYFEAKDVDAARREELTRLARGIVEGE